MENGSAQLTTPKASVGGGVDPLYEFIRVFWGNCTANSTVAETFQELIGPLMA
jgi:hypothetical protein